jgi:hypothetical protein
MTNLKLAVCHRDYANSAPDLEAEVCATDQEAYLWGIDLGILLVKICETRFLTGLLNGLATRDGGCNEEET